jgi:hypothetical protein
MLSNFKNSESLKGWDNAINDGKYQTRSPAKEI